MTRRIIARLDIKGPNLVKGIHLEGLRVLGKPEQFARYYYETGADELLYVDVVASLYNRNSLHEIISRTAREIFIPLTVGGGIRTIDDVRTVLRSGADKVSLNTAAIKNPDFIREAARVFGSSTIAVAIEAIKQPDGGYFAYTDNGREHTGVEVRSWAKRVESLGAGEIILTSVDNEGTGNGFDIELVKSVSSAVSIPVIAHGGAGTLEHCRDAIRYGNASAIAVASVLHYNVFDKLGLLGDFSGEGNLEFAKSGKSFTKISHLEIGDIKRHFMKNDIGCRPPHPRDKSNE